MSKETQAISNDMGQLAEDARALMVATADVAGEKIEEARQHLAATLDSGKNVFGRAKARAVQGARATDQAVHEHPYPVIGFAFGVGVALSGYLLTRWCSHNGD